MVRVRPHMFQVGVGTVIRGATLVVCLCLPLGLATTHREHKVHNMVLYPDKHSWCSGTSIRQVVGHEGCEPLELENLVCVGGCFSYSIPRTEPLDPGQVAPYCDSCQPSITTWRYVNLSCEHSKVPGGSIMKRVEIIGGCRCTSCSGSSSEASGRQGSSLSQPADGEVPQLLHLVHSSQAPNHTKELRLDPHTNHRLSELLRRLTEAEDKGGLDKQSLDAILTGIKSEEEEDDLLDDPHHASHHDHHEENLQLLHHKSEEARAGKLSDSLEEDDLEEEEEEEEEEKTQEEEEEEKIVQEVDVAALRHILARGHTVPPHRRHHSTVSEVGLPKEALEVEADQLTVAEPGQEVSYHARTPLQPDLEAD